jgi:pSer/pThr/pTyr-binding forkhead associated (FHA) protein
MGINLRFSILEPGRSLEEVRPKQFDITTKPLALKIGKLNTAELFIDDDSASRIHAIIEVKSSDDVDIIDLGSLNGTFVNDRKITKTKLKNGDTIMIGGTRLVMSIITDGEVVTEEVPKTKPPEVDAAKILESDDEFKDIFEEAQTKLAQGAIFAKLGKFFLGQLRPVYHDVIEDWVSELRLIFGQDLKPLWNIIEDADNYLLDTGSIRRAKAIKKLINDFGFSEDNAVKIVLATDQFLTQTLANGAEQVNKNVSKK